MSAPSFRVDRSREACDRAEDFLREGDSARDEQDLDSARFAFAEAAKIARHLKRPDLLTRAALGWGYMGAGAGVGIVDYDLVALIEEALTNVPKESAETAVLLGRLATDLYWSQQRSRAIELGDQALDMARRLGDTKTLLIVLMYREWMLWAPSNLRARLAVATEMIEMADPRDWQLRIRGLEYRVGASLELGDIHQVDEDLLEMANIVRRLPSPTGHLERYNVMRTLMRGEFEDTERWLALELAVAERNPNIFATCLGHKVQLLFEQGRAAEALSILTGASAQAPQIPVIRTAVASISAETGKQIRASSELEYLAADDFARVPEDWNWIGTMALLAEVAVRVNDFERAAILYRLLSPYSDRSVTLGFGEFYYNSVSFYLGMVSTAVAQYDRAEGELETAVRFNQRLGAGVALARTRAAYARMLFRRETNGDHSRAIELLELARRAAQEYGMNGLLLELEQLEQVHLLGVNRSGNLRTHDGIRVQPAAFARDGDMWKAEWLGQSVHLRPMKGFEAIRNLLSRPGDDVPIVELGQIMDLVLGGEAPLDSADRGDAGPMLDAEAKQEYRARLRELHTELDEAREFNDLGRIEEHSRELEYLEGELRRAVGLGGRDRRVSSASERARIRVTNAIRAAIARIEQYSPGLGAHLRASIKTGAICSYRPDPGVAITWQLDLGPIDSLNLPKT